MALTTKQLAQLRRTPVGASGNRLQAAMDLAEIKQVPLAERTGLTQPYVSAVAAGKFDTVTVANAAKFAEFFGCYIEDIFPAREAVA